MSPKIDGIATAGYQKMRNVLNSSNDQ